MSSLMNLGKPKPKQDPDYGKAQRLSKKLGAKIEIERNGSENNYWVYGPEKVESHPEWQDDEHFQSDWGGVYYFLLKVADFIEENNL